MTQNQRACELAGMLRKCAERRSCTGCPLNDFAGSCTDKLKQDSAEMLEDQQAIIQALSQRVSEMVAAIVRLREKYSPAVYIGSISQSSIREVHCEPEEKSD